MECESDYISKMNMSARMNLIQTACPHRLANTLLRCRSVSVFQLTEDFNRLELESHFIHLNATNELIKCNEKRFVAMLFRSDRFPLPFILTNDINISFSSFASASEKQYPTTCTYTFYRNG